MVSKALLLLTAAVSAQALTTCVITTTSVLYGFADSDTATSTSTDTETSTTDTETATATPTAPLLACARIVDGLCIVEDFAPAGGLLAKRATTIDVISGIATIDICVKNYCTPNADCKSAGVNTLTATCYLYSDALTFVDLNEDIGFDSAILPPLVSSSSTEEPSSSTTEEPSSSTTEESSSTTEESSSTTEESSSTTEEPSSTEGSSTTDGTTSASASATAVIPAACERVVDGLCVLDNLAPRAGLLVKRATVIGTFPGVANIDDCITEHCSANSACKSAGYDSTLLICYLYSELVETKDLVEQEGFSVAGAAPPGVNISTYPDLGRTSTTSAATTGAGTTEKPVTTAEPITTAEPTTNAEETTTSTSTTTTATAVAFFDALLDDEDLEY